MTAEPKANKGQQTREQLIEVAFAQFSKNGFHGTSMRKIAEEAGLALGGIYNHFASKDDVFKAVILAYHPLTQITPALAAAQGESGEALIRHVAHEFYRSLQAKPDLLNLLFIELIECQARHLSVIMVELFPGVLHLGQRLAATVDVIQGISPFIIMRVFVGSLIGYILTEAVLRRIDFVPLQPTGTFDDFLQLTLHGLVKE
jgi:AcrR family transcriptional regulator